MTSIKVIAVSLILLMFFGCCTLKKSNVDTSVLNATAPVVIYKMKKNYAKKVPITLSEDKSSVVSFPATTDVYAGDKPLLPIALEKGFYLDRKGVTPHSAFLKYSFKKYYRLEQTPRPTELMELIIEDDPFTEMYLCGKVTDYSNLVEELNEIISKGDFSSFDKLK